MIGSLALLPLAACSNGGGDGGGGGGTVGDTTAPTVTATPTTSAFGGGTVDVTLTAVDDQDPDPTIHYTTDLSTPTTLSMTYLGPITISTTTVVKFLAVDASGNESSVQIEGYTLAPTTIQAQLAASGHGAIANESFRHWDEDTEVSTSCAKCHTGDGFNDYAMDGSVDAPGALPLGLYCNACHVAPPAVLYDDLATFPSLEPVAFPSGATASAWSASNMCSTCHQGREAGSTVDAKILATPGGPYTFVNVHYYAAAASLFGAETGGGYEYAGQDYVGRNTFPSHAPEQQSCVGCHMRGVAKDHTFEPQLGDCTTCHTGTSFETLSGSPVANKTAIDAAQVQLLAEIQGYASAVIGQGIVYGDGYPYFFVDLNGNGVADPDEVGFANRYTQFDEALLKAAYNYQVVAKDPNGFIHNGTYLRQLQHDSIVDLGGTPTEIAPGRAGFDHYNASKSEQWHLSGHADSTAEAFRHWDGDPDVPTSCAKCHSSPGFVDYVADGTVDQAAPLGSLVECTACHNSTNLFSDPSTRYDDLFNNAALEPVAFPSGATQTLGNAGNLCMTCHQGRESGASVVTPSDNGVVQTPIDYVSHDFVNRHYYAAAAIFFGADVTAAYEVPGQTYLGKNTYPSHGFNNKDCLQCHARGIQDHSFEPELTGCATCHQGISDFDEIGRAFGAANVDYDGDTVGESFQLEIEGTAATLLATIYAYAVNDLPQSSPVIYGPASYPYWFRDLNANGVLDPGEDGYGNRYRDFDTTMLRAAFNFHAAQDPCGDMHNYKYTLQTLYDQIDLLDDASLNGSPPGLRP